MKTRWALTRPLPTTFISYTIGTCECSTCALTVYGARLRANVTESGINSWEAVRAFHWIVLAGILSMAYPQGYLYQASAPLALYSCHSYGSSAPAAPRADELSRGNSSSSGSAFAPYAGSTAFTSQTPAFNSLQYGSEPASAPQFSSFVVSLNCDSSYDHM